MVFKKNIINASRLSPTKIGLICFGVISVAVILGVILRCRASRPTCPPTPTPAPTPTSDNNYLEHITGLEDVNQKLKITIVTLETRKGHIFDEMIYLHNTTLSNYAHRHGYEYIFKTQYTPATDHTFHQLSKSIISPYWLKLFMVRDILNRTGPESTDFVLWMDSDAIICHINMRIETFLLLPTYTGASVYIGTDDGSDVLCAGVFFIRNDVNGKKFVDDCLRDYEMKFEYCYGDGSVNGIRGEWAGACYEQGVMNARLYGADKSILQVLPGYIICNGGSLNRDAMITHMYGDKQNVVTEMRQLNAYNSNLLGAGPPVASSQLRVAVILTMYATESRKSMYMRRLEWWRASELPVYLVCSKGDGHMGKHPNNFYFYQNEPEVTLNPSNVERASVLKFMKQFNSQDYDIIFKVTGKYIAPHLLELVKYILPTTDIVLQHRNDKDGGQHCEIFGIRPNLMDSLMRYKTDLSLEKSLTQFCHGRIIQRLPPIGIKPEWRIARSFGDTLTYM